MPPAPPKASTNAIAATPNINCINKLQEISMKDGYALPLYNNERILGPHHKREFEIDCVWRSERTTGGGRSKKDAKLDAAQRMWNKFM